MIKFILIESKANCHVIGSDRLQQFIILSY